MRNQLISSLVVALMLGTNTVHAQSMNDINRDLSQSTNAFAACYQQHNQRACNALNGMMPNLDQDSRVLGNLSGRQAVQNSVDNIHQGIADNQRRMLNSNAYWNAARAVDYYESQAEYARARGDQQAAYQYQHQATIAAERAEELRPR